MHLELQTFIIVQYIIYYFLILSLFEELTHVMEMFS